VTNLADALLIGAFNDDGMYMALGKSIAEGTGYRSLYVLGAPVQLRYPPVFPLILAGLWRVGRTVSAVQQLVALLHPLVVGATAGILWWIGRQRLFAPRPMLALLVALPFTFDAAITYYTIPLSEPWFMLGWAGAAMLCFVADGESATSAHPSPTADAGSATASRAPLPADTGSSTSSRASRTALCLALGLIVATTILVRTQAIVLLVALGAGLLSRRFSWRERGAAIAGAVAPLAGWALYHQYLVARGPLPTGPDASPYLSWFRTEGMQVVPALLRVAGTNVHNYVTDLGPYLSGVAILGNAAAVVLLGGMAVAGVAAVRRAPVLATSAVGSIVLLVFWPSAQDRLLLSVMPFAGLAACAALAPIVARWAIRTRRVAGYAAAVVIVLILVRQLDVRREATGGLQGRPPTFFAPLRVLLTNSRYVANVSRWIKSATSNADRVMADGGAGIYLYSGRATVQYSPSLNELAPSPAREAPGRYLASRILDDTLDYAIVSSSPALALDVLELNTACPGTLFANEAALPAPLVVLRVKRDVACLARMAGPMTK